MGLGRLEKLNDAQAQLASEIGSYGEQAQLGVEGSPSLALPRNPTRLTCTEYSEAVRCIEQSQARESVIIMRGATASLISYRVSSTRELVRRLATMHQQACYCRASIHLS